MIRNFLARLFTFLCFATVFYLVLVIVWGSLTGERFKGNNLLVRRYNFGTALRLQQARATKNVDVLVLGSSHAYRGYDVRIFKNHHLSAFNLGSSAQTPAVTELLVGRYLEGLHPKFVIIDLYPSLFNVDHTEDLDCLVAAGELSGPFLRKIVTSRSIRSFNSLVYEVFGKVTGLNKSYPDARVSGSGRYIDGGYVENYDRNLPVKKYPEKSLALREDQLTALGNIVGKLKREKIGYVLVQAPVTQGKYQGIANNDSIDRVLAKFGKYYNFNKILSLPDSSFSDADHLNQYGVNVFNRVLLVQLKKDNFME